MVSGKDLMPEIEKLAIIVESTLNEHKLLKNSFSMMHFISWS